MQRICSFDQRYLPDLAGVCYFDHCLWKSSPGSHIIFNVFIFFLIHLGITIFGFYTSMLNYGTNCDNLIMPYWIYHKDQIFNQYFTKCSREVLLNKKVEIPGISCIRQSSMKFFYYWQNFIISRIFCDFPFLLQKITMRNHVQWNELLAKRNWLSN